MELVVPGDSQPQFCFRGCFSLESVANVPHHLLHEPSFPLFLQRFRLLGHTSHVDIDIINIDIIWSSLDDQKKVSNTDLDYCETCVLLKMTRLQKFPEQSCLEQEAILSLSFCL